jgi:hypothetical protein
VVRLVKGVDVPQ